MRKLLYLWIGLTLTSSLSFAQQTTPETLIPQFTGLLARTEIGSIATYKDGFVVSGLFGGTDGVESPNILYYNGSEWEPFGPFPDPGIRSMVEFDGDLWVSGIYSRIRNLDGQTVIGPYDLVMRWDGSKWVSSNTGIEGVPQKMIVYNEKLYGFGYLGTDVGVNVHLRVWSGSAWAVVPGQPNGEIMDMVVHDGKLMIVGAFNQIGATQTMRIAQFDGTAWASVGSGFPELPTSVGTLNGDLYAGGSIFNVNGSIAWMKRFKDGTWTNIPGTVAEPVSMTTIDDKMYVVQRNEFGATYRPDLIAVWNGNSWEHQSQLLDHRVSGIVKHDNKVIVGGYFAQVQNEWASGLAEMNGSQLTPYSAPEIINRAVSIYTGASKGGDIIVGGSFIRRGDRMLSNIALWDGNDLYALGDGFGNPVYHIVIYDDQIVAANEFVSSQANFTMKSWDGIKWNMLPNLFSNKPEKLFAHNEHLYVGGLIFGQNPNRYFTRWNGSAWDWSLGIPDDMVRGIAVHDGALYVGGDFKNIGGKPINYIGKYENGTWTDMGAGLDGRVRYIYSVDDSLYISGDFTVPGVNSTYNAYVRKGNSWVRPRGNLNGLVTDMDKVGDIVFATGYLDYSGVTLGGTLSRWRDTQWTSVEFTLSGLIWRMLYHNGGLWVLGDMTYNDGSGVRREAALQYQVLDLPGSFLLSAPTQQAVVDSLTPTFRWTPSANATSYLMQIFDNPEYTHPMIHADIVEGTRHKPLISLESGKSYHWRVRARSGAGETNWVNGSFATSLTAVNLDDDEKMLPNRIILHPAYPNPFNPTTNMRFELPEGQLVDIGLYDVLGRRLSTVLTGYKSAGQHYITIRGQNLATGMYFVRLSAGRTTMVQRIMLIK